MSRNRLPPGQQLAAAGKWPVVGERSPAASSAPWTVTISGLVEQPRTWTLDELATLPQVAKSIDIHCVTRWSKFDVRFGGVRHMVLGGVLAGFLLYVMSKVVDDMSKADLMNPMVAAWLPVAIGGLAGSLALLYQEDG